MGCMSCHLIDKFVVFYIVHVNSTVIDILKKLRGVSFTVAWLGVARAVAVIIKVRWNPCNVDMSLWVSGEVQYGELP